MTNGLEAFRLTAQQFRGENTNEKRDADTAQAVAGRGRDGAAACNESADRVSAGGGHASEGEDIEVIEVTLDQALAMIERREIVDAKTIMLAYYARLKALI